MSWVELPDRSHSCGLAWRGELLLAALVIALCLQPSLALREVDDEFEELTALDTLADGHIKSISSDAKELNEVASKLAPPSLFQQRSDAKEAFLDVLPADLSRLDLNPPAALIEVESVEAPPEEEQHRDYPSDAQMVQDRKPQAEVVEARGSQRLVGQQKQAQRHDATAPATGQGVENPDDTDFVEAAGEEAPSEGAGQEAPGAAAELAAARLADAHADPAMVGSAGFVAAFGAPLALAELGEDPVGGSDPSVLCVEGAEGDILGCKLSCFCDWWQQCYPKRHKEDPNIDQGICGMSIVLMMITTFTSLLFVLCLTIGCRLLLQHHEFLREAYNKSNEVPTGNQRLASLINVRVSSHEVTLGSGHSVPVEKKAPFGFASSSSPSYRASHTSSSKAPFSLPPPTPQPTLNTGQLFDQGETGF